MMTYEYTPGDLTKFLGRDGFSSAGALNIPLARKVLEHLQAHPEEHNQHYWGWWETACKTTACIAGMTMLMDSQTTVIWNEWGDMTHAVVDECPMALWDRAEELLGLNRSDSHSLFHESSNERALELLGSYITQAEKVQYA